MQVLNTATKRENAMVDKPTAQNIQDAFLNSARRERATVVIHQLQGSTLTGRIKSFDKFSLLLDVGGQDFLVFKHAISSIAHERKHEAA